MSNAPDPTPVSPPATPKNNYAWIWFFAFIIIASIGVTTFMIAYNLYIQLTPDKLESAWTKWKKDGPKSYNMVYTKRINDDSKVITYGVKVRNGKVIEVKQDKVLLEKTKEQTEDPRIYHSMDSLFRDAERFLVLDAKPEAKRVYVMAIFDDQNGAMRYYVRRVMGGTERVELRIELQATDD